MPASQAADTTSPIAVLTINIRVRVTDPSRSLDGLRPGGLSPETDLEIKGVARERE